jgi:hypothetical protein
LCKAKRSLERYDTFAIGVRIGVQSEIARIGDLLVGKDAVSSNSITPYKFADTSNYRGAYALERPLAFEYKFSRPRSEMGWRLGYKRVSRLIPD